MITKSLLYRLFGWGALPLAARARLEVEGIALLDEGVPGSVSLRNFRKPGRYSGYRCNWFSGSIVLTRHRIAGFAFSRPVIDLPLSSPAISQLQCSVERGKRLSIEFDVSVFHDGWSGHSNVRFKTPLAVQFVEHLVAKGAVRA